MSVLRLFLVRAVQAGRLDRVEHFLSLYGQQLVQGPDEWGHWFALPYLSQPESDARFQVWFLVMQAAC